MILDVMVYIKKREKNQEVVPEDILSDEGDMQIVPMLLECVEEIS